MKEKSQRRRLSAPLRVLIKLAAVLAAVWMIFSFVLGVKIYHGERMFPAVKDGDLVIFSRLSAPSRGDVAVYLSKDGKPDLSRVCGTPGMEIDISPSGELRTNGYVPMESVFYRTEPHPEGDLLYPLVVGEGAFFLLDDYRTIGEDSRLYGELPRERVLGKVIYIVRRRGF